MPHHRRGYFKLSLSEPKFPAYLTLPASFEGVHGRWEQLWLSPNMLRSSQSECSRPAIQLLRSSEGRHKLLALWPQRSPGVSNSAAKRIVRVMDPETLTAVQASRPPRGDTSALGCGGILRSNSKMSGFNSSTRWTTSAALEASPITFRSGRSQRDAANHHGKLDDHPLSQL
jgi:hypothetical protein